MKGKRIFAPRLALAAVFVVALLLLAGTYAVIASQVSSAGPDLALAGVSSSKAADITEWMTTTTVIAGDCITLPHGLDRDPDTLVVEMWFQDTDGGWGLNRRYYGGAEDEGLEFGAYWQHLTANSIEVCRRTDDNAADEIRVRISIPPTLPDHDSGWMDIFPNVPITYSHGLGDRLGIAATDLTVGLWFSSTTRGIHHFGYGGLADDPDPGPPPVPGRQLGASWQELTANTVKIRRHRDDQDVEQVRVIVVNTAKPGARPQYDSLEAFGGWRSITHGTTVFTHSLNWDPDMLLVRAECYAPALGGIHQVLAGGNHDWMVGWQGANLQNVTTNTIEIYRQSNDMICDQARVRIWRRSIQTFLPVVLSNHEP